MPLEVKPILNCLQRLGGFVCQEVQRRRRGDKPPRIEIRREAHRSIRGKGPECPQPAPGYDRPPERGWLFVPLGGIKTCFIYAPRRGECAEHGVGGEPIPWSQGKRPIPPAMRGFLARGARPLSWRETARAFHTRWECGERSGKGVVPWGPAHRKLEGLEAIGLAEIHWGQGQRADNFPTVIYPIDSHCRRLLWGGASGAPKRPGAGVWPRWAIQWSAGCVLFAATCGKPASRGLPPRCRKPFTCWTVSTSRCT